MGRLPIAGSTSAANRFTSPIDLSDDWRMMKSLAALVVTAALAATVAAQQKPPAFAPIPAPDDVAKPPAAAAKTASGLASVVLQPFGSFDWGHIHGSALTERAADGISLAVQDSATASARPGVGLRVTRSFNRSGRHRWTPRVEVRYARELMSHDPLTVAFVDAPAAPFGVSGIPLARQSVSTSAGLAATLGGRVVVSGDYRASFETDRRAQTLTVGFAF